MGKLRKGRRSQKSRTNPVARKDGSSKQDIKDENTRQNKIVPLISKLSSSAPNDRSVALSAIMVLAEDARMRRLLLKERLVTTLLEQTLNDLNDEIVVELFGLLRNLTIEEGHEVAKHLWRSNIWAAIEKGLEKIEKSFEFIDNNLEKKMEKKRALLLYDFTENLLSLVVAIAASSEELYGHICSKMDRILPLTVSLVAFNTPKLRTSLKLFNALLDLLYEFASDSSDFIVELVNNTNFSLNALESALQDPIHDKNHLGKVYVEGLRFHIYEVDPEAKKEVSKEKACLSILGNIFHTISGTNLDEIHKQLNTTDTEPVQKDNRDKKEEKPQDIDVPFGGVSPEKAQASADLQAIDVTIDLFTSLCEYLAIDEGSMEALVVLGEEVRSFLLDTAFASCLHLLKFDHEHGSGLGLTGKVLVALNNLSWLFVTSKETPVSWYNCALELWDSIECVSDSADIDTQRLCLNIFWALSKCLGSDVQRKVRPEIVDSLLNKCQDVIGNATQQDDPALAYEFVLSSIGFMGTLAQTIGNIQTTRAIGEFLLGAIDHFSQGAGQQTQAVEIVVESLDQIYDIFGDAEYEYDQPVFVEGGFLTRLETIEPTVRNCYKRIDKHREPELRARAEEAWTNLSRFTEYKRHERL